MTIKRFNEIKKSFQLKISKFISKLTKNGIPLSAIQLNETGYGTYVIVKIPYGKNRGETKRWKQYQDRNVKSAIKFWNSKK